MNNKFDYMRKKYPLFIYHSFDISDDKDDLKIVYDFELTNQKDKYEILEKHFRKERCNLRLLT